MKITKVVKGLKFKDFESKRAFVTEQDDVNKSMYESEDCNEDFFHLGEVIQARRDKEFYDEYWKNHKRLDLDIIRESTVIVDRIGHEPNAKAIKLAEKFGGELFDMYFLPSSYHNFVFENDLEDNILDLYDYTSGGRIFNKKSIERLERYEKLLKVKDEKGDNQYLMTKELAIEFFKENTDRLNHSLHPWSEYYDEYLTFNVCRGCISAFFELVKDLGVIQLRILPKEVAQKYRDEADNATKEEIDSFIEELKLNGDYEELLEYHINFKKSFPGHDIESNMAKHIKDRVKDKKFKQMIEASFDEIFKDCIEKIEQYYDEVIAQMNPELITMQEDDFSQMDWNLNYGKYGD